MTPQFETLKPASAPARGTVDVDVAERVAQILLDVEARGMDAVRAYSRELDDWGPQSFEVTPDALAAAADQLEPELRGHLQLGLRRTREFAALQRDSVRDMEREIAPGLYVGHRHVPVGAVGAYLPAGRRPLMASAFMTVLVPKAAGVSEVLACTPPRAGKLPHPAMLHTAALSGADAVFALGGVQALAAMAFGLEGRAPVDMIVGAGNVYVTEAKRQLFGRVGIDLLAGPSEILLIADSSADPDLVAADLLGQAEHGPTSPSILVAISRDLATRTLEAIARQLEALPTDNPAHRAWPDHGVVVLVSDREEAAQAADHFAPEHLEVHAEDPDWFLDRLRNYGSLFLGARTTVAFSDKGITGTNHVLPTRRAARYTGGLSVLRFLKTLTYQRITDERAQRPVAEAVAAISHAEDLPAHEATALRRLHTELAATGDGATG